MKTSLRVVLTAFPLVFTALSGCGESTDTPDAGSRDAAPGADAAGGDVMTPTDGGGVEVPATYTFESRFMAGSSVRYAGQSFRQVLISDLKSHISGLTARIDNGTLTPTTGDVRDELEFYFDFDVQTSGDVDITLTTMPSRKQAAYRDLSMGGAKLQDKIAGNDPVGQHKDWNMLGIAGWTGSPSPEALVRQWFDQLDRLAVDRANGIIPLDPAGAPIANVYVTADGLDLRELLQKFLDGAVAYSQGTDDYLDDDLEGRGLNSSNAMAEGMNPYTALEHGWDEGFGYFGAARDYGDYTDEELAAAGGRPEYARGYHDTNGDGMIDLLTEMNFGHSTNAAKRDRGSSPNAPTDFTKEAWDGFRRGRAIITAAGGPLSAAQMEALKAERNAAVLAWEKAIASTAVHYINDVLKQMARFGTPAYSFLDHAKQWSELKGFALSLQFNPRSRLTAAQFASLHEKIGVRPVLAGPNADAYRTALREARTILKDAYGFADANMGDADGNGGW